MTTLERERDKQKLWRLRPEFAPLRVFDELLENEFLPPEEHRERERAAVRSVVGFAAVHTPWYASLFARLGLRPADVDGPADLPRLPRLTKQDVLDHPDELRSTRLPPGEAAHEATKSSGTTGRPVSVLQSKRSSMMFSILMQRNARIFGLDPMGGRLVVNPRHYLKRPDGSDNPEDNVVHLPRWRYLGQFFETGPEYAFNVSAPMEQQVAWLKELRPDHAVVDPGVPEEWLLANGGVRPVDSLRVLVTGGSQLPPSLRALLEERYATPIFEVYGLNEIGIVASRCEAGRYHVNIEHCLVEIVGEDGQACSPGETGHVLVTALRNPVMPLIRYDTGDIAQATDNVCLCGRTLPSFGPIAGRYRRYAGLPHGTRERFQAIRKAVEQHAPGELAFLRRYQVHQDRQNHFTLRLRTAGPVPEAFRQNVLRAWEPVAGDPPSPLAITEVDEIPSSPGGKLLDFASDFHEDFSIKPVHTAKTQAGKTIIFDMDDTLLDERSARKVYLAALYANHRAELPYDDEEKFRAAWAVVGGRHYHRYIGGELSLHEFRRVAVREVFGRPEMSDAETDRIIGEYNAVYEASWRLYPDAMPLLDALGGRTLGVVTNGNHQQQMKKLERTGILDRFRVVLVSESVGHAKPAPEIFHRACSELGSRPEACVYVGNEWARDVEGPRRAGLTPIWLNRWDPGADARPYGVLSIQSLTELVERPDLRALLGL